MLCRSQINRHLAQKLVDRFKNSSQGHNLLFLFVIFIAKYIQDVVYKMITKISETLETTGKNKFFGCVSYNNFLLCKSQIMERGGLSCGAVASQSRTPLLSRRLGGGGSRASGVGALRKCAGGTFLASDRSGYAARREVGGRAHRTSGRERHPASGGPISLFIKRNGGKRKCACGRGVKKRASRCLLGGRADARKCRGGLRGRRWCGGTGERFLPQTDCAAQRLPCVKGAVSEAD